MARATKRLFICLDNAGYEGSLERLKIYVALPDGRAERRGHLRIIDESGEDYLYPVQRFVAAELPLATRRAVLHAARHSIEPIAAAGRRNSGIASLACPIAFLRHRVSFLDGQTSLTRYNSTSFTEKICSRGET